MGTTESRTFFGGQQQQTKDFRLRENMVRPPKKQKWDDGKIPEEWNVPPYNITPSPSGPRPTTQYDLPYNTFFGDTFTGNTPTQLPQQQNSSFHQVTDLDPYPSITYETPIGPQQQINNPYDFPPLQYETPIGPQQYAYGFDDYVNDVYGTPSAQSSWLDNSISTPSAGTPSTGSAISALGGLAGESLINSLSPISNNVSDWGSPIDMSNVMDIETGFVSPMQGVEGYGYPSMTDGSAMSWVPGPSGTASTISSLTGKHIN